VTDDKRILHPATAAELEESLSFALRYAGRKRVHTADDVMARVTAERLVRHLERSGYVYVTWNTSPLTLARLRNHGCHHSTAGPLADRSSPSGGYGLAVHTC